MNIGAAELQSSKKNFQIYRGCLITVIPNLLAATKFASEFNDLIVSKIKNLKQTARGGQVDKTRLLREPLFVFISSLLLFFSYFCTIIFLP